MYWCEVKSRRAVKFQKWIFVAFGPKKVQKQMEKSPISRSTSPLQLGFFGLGNSKYNC